MNAWRWLELGLIYAAVVLFVWSWFLARAPRDRKQDVLKKVNQK